MGWLFTQNPFGGTTSDERETQYQGVMNESSAAPRKQAPSLAEPAEGSESGKGVPPIRPRETDSGIPPMSFAQESLWFLQELDPSSTAYNLKFRVDFEREIVLETLQRTLDEVARRNEVLRTTFLEVEEKPAQHISPDGHWPLVFRDWAGLSEESRRRRLQALGEEEESTPFDLSDGPPIRATLIRVAPERFTLFLTLHHIVMDEGSLDTFFNELDAVYRTFEQNLPSPLEELPVQYADFAVWQRGFLQGAELERQFEYWREKLRGIPALELLLDRPRPAFPTEKGGGEGTVVPDGVDSALDQICTSEEVTPFLAYLAAFKLLLHRYSGQTDLVVGTPSPNRNRRGIEKLIGCFVNTLVIRSDMEGDPTFREFLAQLRKTMLEAQDHQELPFEKLVEELAPERSIGLNPLVQVLFGFGDRMVAEPGFGGGAGGATEGLSHQATKVDLEVRVTRTPGDTEVSFNYRTDLFEASTIRRMLHHYQTILQAAVTSPDIPVSALTLLSDEESVQVVEEWNQTEASFPNDATLHGLFEAQVAKTPHAPAVRFGDQCISYSELDARASSLALELHRRHLSPNGLVGVYMERSVEMVVALLGTLKAGAAYLPLEPTNPIRRVTSIVEDARPGMVLTQAGYAEALMDAWEGDEKGEWPSVLVLDEESEWSSGADLEAPIRVSPENLAYVIFTSGSTGRPKGVMVPHAAICNRLFWMQSEYGLDTTDRVLQKTPFTFDVSVWEFFWPLMVGAELVMAEPEGHKDPAYLYEIMGSASITTMHFVPSMMRVFLADSEEGGPLPLKRVFSSGEALTSELARRFLASFPTTELHNLYGPTEAAVDVTYYRCRSDEERVNVPIGRPVANTRLYILDRHQRPVPVGVFGELYLGGSQVARGYLGRPELTAEKFVRDPWSDDSEARLYKTGDMVRYLPDGNVEYRGRSDFQVKIRGNRIECGEVERTLESESSVTQAVVLAWEDDSGNPYLIGYVVPDPTRGEGDFGPLADELRTSLSESLPEYMVPAAFIVLEALPLTPSGKLDRKALPSPTLGFGTGENSYVPPGNATEKSLVELWENLLPVQRVGIEDRFFDLGGHSLLATQLVSRIRTVCQAEISLRTVFDNPTISSLAPEVVRARSEAMESPGTGHPSFETNEGREPRPPEIRQRPSDEPAPLSLSQQRLWFLHQLDPESPAYNTASALRLKGPLKIDVLQATMEEIVRRHEPLRTSFPAVDGHPSQSIAPSGAVHWVLKDVGTEPSRNREAAAREMASVEASKLFDLAQGPVFRVILIRLSDADHLLVLAAHHIVSDGWSSGLLNRELTTLYEAFAKGKTSPLPELPIQYADFAYWQRNWMKGAVLERQLEYWKEQLAGVPPLELPTDRPRPRVQTFRGAEESLSIPLTLRTGLQELSEREGSTLAITLQAAFKALLFRYTHQTDIAVGSPIANRNREEIEGLVGFFVNTQVIRTDLSGDPSVLELIGRVREVSMGAYDHQDLPFDKLVEELKPERDASRPPLFQVVFAVQNSPGDDVTLTDLQVEPFTIPVTAARFDLECHVFYSGKGLELRLAYNTDLFDQGTIRRFGERYRTLLEAVVEDPSQPISDLPLLGGAEAAELRSWKPPTLDYPWQKPISRWFEEQVERTPHARAVVTEDADLTFHDLNVQANRLAHELRGMGVGPEVPVALCTERGMDMVVGALAVVKAGGAYLPMDPEYPTARIQYMLEDSGTPLLLTQRHLATDLPSPPAGKVVCVDEPRIGLDTNPESTAGPEHPAYVIYTSGSTGRPKAVVVEHRSLGNLLACYHQAFHISPEHRTTQVASIAFDASVFELWPSLSSGAELHIPSDGVLEDPPRLVRWLCGEGITISFLPTALAEMVIREEWPADCTLQTLLTAGDRLRAVPELPLPFRLFNLYGPTENTVWSTGGEVLSGFGPPSIGQPIPNTYVYVLDTRMQQVPIGVPGTLFLGGAGLARGYLNRPDLTAERFVHDPFSNDPAERLYNTGDIVRFLPSGDLEFLGRNDEQVNVRGFRIELGEVESALLDDPRVLEAVALVREDSPGDQRLVAYLVTDSPGIPETEDLSLGGPGGNGTSEELMPGVRRRLAQSLPGFMIPSILVPMDELPRGATGKVDRKALPAPTHDRIIEGPYEPPISDTETRLAEIWCEILGLERVGRRDGFFDLGGHSLLGTQVVSRVRDTFHREVPLRIIFEAPTLAAMARRIDEEDQTGDPDEPKLAPTSRTRRVRREKGEGGS